MAINTGMDLGAGFDRFQCMVDAVKDHAMFVVDADGHVMNWNSGAERFTGYSELEILGRHFSRFYCQDDVDDDLPARILATARDEGRFESSRWQVRKDGSALWADIVATPIVRDGVLIGYVQISRDLTERVKIEEELVAARQTVLQAQEAEVLGRLTSGVARDFSALMTSLRTSADHLAHAGNSEERRIRHKTVAETIDQASTLAAQLLTFARRQPLRPEPFDIVEILLAIRPLLQAMLGERVTLRMQLTPELVRIDTDRHQFEAAIINLVVNARDAITQARDFGTVWINIGPGSAPPKLSGEIHHDGPFVAISVIDDGSGIAPEIADSIFEPFFTTHGDTQASGLGLSQARGFARQAGGDISVANKPDGGSVFTLVLPRVVQRVVTPLTVQATSADLPAPSIRGSILLVEDNDRIAEVAIELLQDIGLDCVWAQDAEEALAKLDASDSAFDLVLTDVVMPGMSGIALARAISVRWPDLPVILTSGYSDDLTTGHGGDFDMIQKPYHRNVLMSAIKRHLVPGRTAA